MNINFILDLHILFIADEHMCYIVALSQSGLKYVTVVNNYGLANYTLKYVGPFFVWVKLYFHLDLSVGFNKDFLVNLMENCTLVP